MLRRIALLAVLAFSAIALAQAHLEADTESAAYWPPTHKHAGLSKAAAVETWNYDRTADIGPSNWYKTTPICGGSAQSPIDVNTNSVVYDPNLQPIKFNYQQANRTVVNNGHALQVNENAGVTTSTVTGGALNGMTYAFAQFHVHLMGEHTVNGGAYPLELHLVHSNTDTSQTTPPTPRELTVVGLLFKEGSYNKALENFVNSVNVAGFSAANSYTTAIIDLTALLPVDPSYYTYQGSLTTPGCRETVTWHVMTQLLEVSPEQLGILRAAGPVTNNNRPVQPLNGRLVRTNSPALARAGTTSAASSQQAVAGGAGQVVNINFANMLSGFSRN